jgi:hypothetical protein
LPIPPRQDPAGMGGFSGARAMAVAGHGRMGFAGPGRFACPVRMGPGRVAWAARGNWSGNRCADNWRGGHWRGGRFWPWGVGAGVALAAALPYYGGYGYRLRILCPVGTRLWLGERLQLSVLWRLRLLLITSYLYLRGHPKVAPLALNSSFRSLLR